MKFTVATVLGVILAASAASAGVYLRSEMIRPCSFWTSHSHQGASSGYLCSSPGMTVDVPHTSSVEQAFWAFENKIAELEKRIQELEKKNP